MTADGPDTPKGSTALPQATVSPERVRPATPLRTRIAGVLLVIACLLAVTGAVLPWLTTVNVSIPSGFRSQPFTWHVWSTGCGVLFLLFVIPLPLFYLLRAGLRAIRGLPLSLGRRSAVLLSLAGCAGTVIFVVLLGIEAGFATVTFLGRSGCCRTDIVIESGFYVSLASYTLAMIASLLLPARAGI
jgi:hypothetical protein